MKVLLLLLTFVPFSHLSTSVAEPIGAETESSSATPESRSVGDVLYRVNVGGTQTNSSGASSPDWTGDTDTNPSQYSNSSISGGETYITGETVTLGSSVPSHVPASLFKTERWDDAGGEALTWSFPVSSGDYEVRLYFAEIYNRITAPGQRVFDVEIEGETVLTEFDQYAEAGGLYRGIVKSFTTTVEDDHLDISFLHVIENPSVKAIEVLAVDGNSTANTSPVVTSIDNKEVTENATLTVDLSASDPDGDPISLSTSTLPSFASFTDHGDGTGTVAFDSEDGDAGEYSVTVIATDGQDSDSESFTVTVTESTSISEVLFRVNAGGRHTSSSDSSSPDWTEDDTSDPSPYSNASASGSRTYDTNKTVTLGASVPSGVPASLFQTERWDDAGGEALTWSFPVSSGRDYEVRLYFAEIYNGITAPGQRVFDVQIEGTTVLTDFDQYAEAGGRNKGIMKSFTTTVEDDHLNISFLHVVENPAVKAIEILGADGGSNENTTPVLATIGNQTLTENATLNVGVSASDADGDPVTLSTSTLPAFASFTDNGGGSGTLSLRPETGDAGDYSLTVTASDGQDSDSESIAIAIDAESTESSAGSAVTSFTLVNATTEEDIGVLEDGETINLAQLPTRDLNVRANTQPATVGSVEFDLDGKSYSEESVAPYALAGDVNGNYHAWTPSVGQHTISATPNTASHGEGTTLAISFTVSDNTDDPAGGDDPSGGDDVAGGHDGSECNQTMSNDYVVSGELRKWHPVTVTFEGPCLSETSSTNPFLDYRLDVTVTHQGSGTTYTVPGFFAADGNAAETSASKGNKWRVHFTPDRTGEWAFEASFRTGANVAISTNQSAGSPASFDGTSGSFSVAETNKSGRDHRSKGMLRYVGEHYLRFDNGDYFIKGGADSPENFLGYEDFDGTYDNGGSFLHDYGPHVSDWQSEDPTWQGGKGKGIIGAVNYLASEEMNSVYFLTMNVGGDGNDVWPWTGPTNRKQYDVSKLAQWDVVFSHMDRKGIMLHVVTQETENDHLLDRSELGTERKLYYRELVARFAHHMAVTWNLGEENTNTDAQRKAYADYIRALDPYDHHITVHTYPAGKEAVYEPLLGYEHFEGPSIQLRGLYAHSEVLEWVNRSASSGRPWVVMLDEPGTANTGVTPDGPKNNHDVARKNALWGALMAGGGGVEWYFGYQFEHNDLTAEDWRSRDNFWDYTRYALEFFHANLPFWNMSANDGLTSSSSDYVLAEEGSVYAIYFLDASSPGTLDLRGHDGTFSATWFNPRTGTYTPSGSLNGGDVVALPDPPSDASQDWALLLKNPQGSSVATKQAAASQTLEVLPDEFGVAQNYPNPFNASTVIELSLPQPVHTRLVIYDVAGREVARLMDDVQPAGTHSVRWDATGVPSGVYLFRVEAGSFTHTGRMTVVR